ncbi:MAG: hypothetical protein DCF21_20405, partial [Leptolyngbya sp.]
TSRSEPSLGLYALPFRYRLNDPLAETMIEALCCIDQYTLELQINLRNLSTNFQLFEVQAK